MRYVRVAQFLPLPKSLSGTLPPTAELLERLHRLCPSTSSPPIHPSIQGPHTKETSFKAVLSAVSKFHVPILSVEPVFPKHFAEVM